MLVQNLLLALTVSALGLAQDVDNDDIPSQCTAVCSSIVTLSRDCDRQHDDNDRAYLDCVCQAPNANSQVPICEACVAQFDNDGRDNDVNDLIRSCSFTTTTYNPSAASAPVTVISGANSNSLSIVTSSAGSASAPATTAGGAASTQGQGQSSPTTGSAVPENTGAASGRNVEGAAVAAIGVFGVALGML